tara:strand:+ start:319 stop:843 length:525 start_codon:yes stop_codon:yes gene_type:complete
MKFSKSEYNKIKNDPRISLWIDDWLIPIISISDSERLIINQSARKRNQESISEWIKSVKKIQTILLDDPELSRFLEIDITKSKVEDRLTFLMNYKDRLKGQRASTKKEIFYILRIIFNTLADMGLGQTKQIDFIYRIYEENNFENYATAKNEDVKKALRERIRKDQEKAVKYFN